MTATVPRKSISINDYPEHLNPFREDDNHNKIRFWTIGRRLSRSNSINFSGIKDLKNSWALRSFMKKGKKKDQPQSPQENKTNQINGDASPIVYRRAIQYSSTSNSGTRSTVASPERYVYGGSITPLPRSRFQERLRSCSQNEVSSLSMTPRMARSEVSGSRLSVESTNPFEDLPPIPPVRASRRKKKKAPPPPPSGVADISMNSETSELQTSIENSILEQSIAEEKKTDGELEIEDMKLDIELKIIEDEDVKDCKKENTQPSPEHTEVSKKETVEIEVLNLEQDKERKTLEPKEPIIMRSFDSVENNLNSVSFPKIDIVKYRRNSSVNEDDIRLRRGNLEDFHALTTKRSKSLTNALDATYVSYDINLNEKDTTTDANGNEEPKKVICKLYDESSRKQSIDTVSSTEKEFLEIDRVRREFETEINKLNAALEEDFSTTGARMSVSDIKRKFDKSDVTSPNPIPKPRRSHYSDSGSPVNGNVHI